MKIKTSELTGAALDWAVAACEETTARGREDIRWLPCLVSHAKYSTDWSQSGPIIERKGISVIRLDDEDIPDAEGFWTGKKVSRWGAVIRDRHGLEENHGSQGDYWGMSYHVDENAVCGPTPLIAAMRCFVASKLGEEVDIPDELVLPGADAT